MLDSEKKKVLLEAVKGRLSITWENGKESIRHDR